MKLMFVCSEYCGNADAGARCIKRLRAELQRQGVASDVLTYDWSGNETAKTEDKLGTTYTAKTWYRHARLTRDSQGRIRMSPVRWAKVLGTRGYAMLTEGKSYAQRGMPVGSTRALSQRLRELCLQNQYDWVVSVSYPFANHLAVLNAGLKNIKIALYNLDPYWNHQTYDPAKAAKRAEEEAAVYEKADHVFCTPEQLPDYQNERFDKVKNKITPLNYPNFVKPQIERRSDLRFDPNETNLLYLGTIYGDIRKPDALFALFEQAVKGEPRLHLYMIGKKFGAQADRYLVEYSQKLGDRLSVCAPVPPDETADLMQQADILVNLGNAIHNQMPSKLLEYIAAGKPILNISIRRDCNTLPLMQRYPRAFQWFADDTPNEEAIDRFLDFCRTARQTPLSWQELTSLYPDQSLYTVAEKMMEKLNAVAPEGVRDG